MLFRSGERSTPVVYYGTALKDGEGEQGEDGTKLFRFIRSFNVFNAGQIDGLPERFYAECNESAPVAERIPELDAFVRRTGADVRHGGGRAFYRRSDDFIQLPEFGAFTDAEQYYATLAHELTHWTMHTSRLDRDMGRKRWGDEGYAAEELVAELGSAFLSADLGLTPETRVDHASYIANWLTVLKNDKRAIFTAAAHAERACGFLHGLQPDAIMEKAA